jgi:hypothetical protein
LVLYDAEDLLEPLLVITSIPSSSLTTPVGNGLSVLLVFTARILGVSGISLALSAPAGNSDIGVDAALLLPASSRSAPAPRPASNIMLPLPLFDFLLIYLSNCFDC